VAVSSQAVANAFLKLAQAEGKRLTNMQLQKLVFLAQGYALALIDRPIFYHNAHAWQWGPVIPKLYKELQRYGAGDVAEEIQATDSEGSTEAEVVRGVWDAHKGYTGSQLSSLTHKQGTPWSVTWEKERFAVIPEELIAGYYKQQMPVAR
jgi:uncharacterized phage-associated protein